jgi:hypothetical protein
MKGVLLNRELALKTKALVEGHPYESQKRSGNAAITSGYISPVEITTDWSKKENGGYKAKCKRLWFNEKNERYNAQPTEPETDVFYPLSNDQPPCTKGDRVFAVYRGRWEIIAATGEKGEAAEKELFPVIVYKRTEINKAKIDGREIEVPYVYTYLICPGGYNERSYQTVHSFCIEKNQSSNAMFGKLPKAMSNFSASIVDNLLICVAGDIDDGIKYPSQIYDLKNNTWSKTDGNTSLAGCPLYIDEYGQIVVAGGSTAYYISSPHQVFSTGIQFYGHSITYKWYVDGKTGTISKHSPLRQVDRQLSPDEESPTLNREKIILKQNFSGIPYKSNLFGKKVDFIAVGGNQNFANYPTAVVSYYSDEDTGTFIASESRPDDQGYVQTFADSPVPLGECGAVHVTKYKNETVNWLVAIGGRMLVADGYILHNTPYVLDLDQNMWRNDIFPAMPTPRYNAGVSPVVTTTEPNVESLGTDKHDRIFVIGGRTQEGLTSKIESLNLTTGTWETHWAKL